MNTQNALKGATSIVIGVGTFVVMGGMLKIPIHANVIERVTGSITKFAIMGIIADKTTDYVNDEIDKVFCEIEGVQKAIKNEKIQEG